ncbi:MAG: PTS sugar transporter subunit IIA [Planctomycetota bacterium JB042]
MSDFWKLFRSDTIRVGLEATEKDAVLSELLELTVEAGRIEPGVRDELLAALREREKIGSTGIGAGIAIPHVKNDAVTETITAVGVASSPIEYDAVDGEPCDLFILLISPASQAENHLQILRWLSSVVRHPDFGRFLRTTKTSKDAAGLFKELGE